MSTISIIAAIAENNAIGKTTSCYGVCPPICDVLKI